MYRDAAWHILTTDAEQALDHASSYRHATLHYRNPMAVHCSSTSSQSVRHCRSFLAAVVSLTLVITEEKPTEKLQINFAIQNVTHNNIKITTNVHSNNHVIF